jgi:hypothetical protein
MSSTRKLSDKLPLSDELRAIELLDWETKPQDFERLFEHVIGLLSERGWTREKLFALIPEEQFRREVRGTAQTFQERFITLPGYIFMWFHTSRLPEASRQKKIQGES